jgi:hypothetical protein
MCANWYIKYEMKEIYRQQYPGEASSHSQTETLDRNQLEREFKSKWTKERQSRIVIENQDGTQTIHEAFRIVLSRDPVETESLILDFTMSAVILGYEFPVQPILIPPIPTPDNKGINPPTLMFFVSRTEHPTK